ncbi:MULTISPECIES: hypothetical protein [unclassified Cryobacterium]|uniref:hypothetical protein n=1 Tax=unclassified Cryobacterium TaxID=2649013 RepID=UPI001447A8E2|nr:MULTISPECIES: hypothetical protein [unclassified Cryobacterium]
MTVTVGELRVGATADSVLPTATAAVAEMANVEAADVGVRRGRAQLTVRFTGDDDETAMQLGAHVASVVDTVARVIDWSVTRRVRGDWLPVAPAR